MVRTEIRAIDAANALLDALRLHFAGCFLRVEHQANRTWSSITFRGARHELLLFVEGAGAGAMADAFVLNPPAESLELRGHTLCDLKPGNASRACRGSWARIAIEALTVENSPLESPTVIPDEDVPPEGIVHVVDRDGQPFFLLGFADGTIVITNAAPAPGSLKLHRFANAGQAHAAGRVLKRHASLDANGETWFVPTARETTPLTREWIAAFIVWGASLERELSQALRFLGAGAYPLTEQAKAYL
jgi:hypothetical protein